MIYIKAAREAYDASEINDVGYIISEDNTAEGLTKKKRCSFLGMLLDAGRLNVEAPKWIIRC